MSIDFLRLARQRRIVALQSLLRRQMELPGLTSPLVLRTGWRTAAATAAANVYAWPRARHETRRSGTP